MRGNLGNYFRIKRHLEPLAIAANITQSDCARLDIVLATLINLYRQYHDPTLDEAVRTAALQSIEKRWANCDRPIFILALVLNPYIRASAFLRSSPYRFPDKLWDLARNAFIRFYAVEPNMELQTAFTEYLHGMGAWSDSNMQLQEFNAATDREKTPVNLISLWCKREPIIYKSERSSSEVENGVAGLVKLATRILSIVPNTAPTERLFSQFGIVHTKLCNRLDPEKVRKQVLIKTNMMNKYPLPTWMSQKRKFEVDELEPTSAASGANSIPTQTPQIEIEPVPRTLSTPTTTPSSMSDSESLITCSFPEVVRTLVSDASEADSDLSSDSAAGPTATTTITPSDVQPSTLHDGSDPSHLLMKNLFHFPSPDETTAPSLKALLAFWQAGETALANERQLAIDDDNARGGLKSHARGQQELAPIDSDRQWGRPIDDDNARGGQKSCARGPQEWALIDKSHARGQQEWALIDKSHARGRQELALIDDDNARGGQKSCARAHKSGHPSTSPMRGADKSWHPSTVTDNWDDVRGSHRRRQRERRTTVLCEGPQDRLETIRIM
ncbi:hypothetical protein BU15DRAFT_63247 [Melanogaster broomeanus]|nr:hypothetical protein BU15DRAFT_63247 [Melanogaster broomeanus]